MLDMAYDNLFVVPLILKAKCQMTKWPNIWFNGEMIIQWSFWSCPLDDELYSSVFFYIIIIIIIIIIITIYSANQLSIMRQLAKCYIVS